MIDTGGTWTLTPAYDLLNVTIVNPVDIEELALTLEGKKKKLKREHFERLAIGLGLNEKQTQGVFNRFEKSRTGAFDWIDRSFLSAEYREKYKTTISDRYQRIAVY